MTHPEQDPNLADFHLRRRAYFRSLLADRDFQEFIQGELKHIADTARASVRNPKTRGVDLESARDRMNWAEDLEKFVPQTLAEYDRQEEERAKTLLEAKNPPPRGLDADK